MTIWANIFTGLLCYAFMLRDTIPPWIHQVWDPYQRCPVPWSIVDYTKVSMGDLQIGFRVPSSLAAGGSLWAKCLNAWPGDASGILVHETTESVAISARSLVPCLHGSARINSESKLDGTVLCLFWVCVCKDAWRRLNSNIYLKGPMAWTKTQSRYFGKCSSAEHAEIESQQSPMQSYALKCTSPRGAFTLSRLKPSFREMTVSRTWLSWHYCYLSQCSHLVYLNICIK